MLQRAYNVTQVLISSHDRKSYIGQYLKSSVFVDFSEKRRTIDTNEIVSFSYFTYLYLKKDKRNRHFWIHPINAEREWDGYCRID